jgi:hypothetical protein
MESKKINVNSEELSPTHHQLSYSAYYIHERVSITHCSQLGTVFVNMLMMDDVFTLLYFAG